MRATPGATATKALLAGLAGGVAVELASLLAALASGGAGHGDYIAARALFPVPMLLTVLHRNTIGAASFGLALVQFPLYGALLGWTVARRNYLPAGLIALAHCLAAWACFAGWLPNFD